MKRRTLIALSSTFIYVLSFVFIFSLPQIQSSSTIFIVAVLLLISFSVSQTGFSVSQYSLAGEMTTNSVELSGLLSLANVLGQIFSTAGIALTPMIVSAAGGGRRGYIYMAIALAVLASISMLIFALKTREIPVKIEGHQTEEFPLLVAVRSTLANRPFYLLILFLIFQGIGSSILITFLPFANQYVLIGTSTSLSVLILLVRVSGLAGMIVTAWLVGRFGDSACLRWSNWLIAAGFMLLFTTSFAPLWATWISIGVVGAAAGINYVVVQTAILEVSQLKVKGGVVIATGFYFGVMTAATKLCDSAGGFVGGELLSAIGFVSGGAHQSAHTILWLRFGYTLVPFVLSIVGAGILHFVRLPDRPVSNI
jgi:Na+/melibiose symporter-like transporter